MNKIKAIKGTYDILPEDVGYWQVIERVVLETMRLYGYSEIRTPVFEETGLFARSIGEDTDIVGKEMYTFQDMGKRNLSLRPEGTAPLVRAFIEHSLDQKGLPQKLWYMGPMFRQEKPQKGRQRQFHQFGVEVIGSSSPLVDAEVMKLFDSIADQLGLGERSFSLNCLGGTESRNAYKTALVSFLDKVDDKLCDDCKRRKVTNPLRVLDCKVPGCREVLDTSQDLPKTVDYLIPEDRKNFEKVQACMDDLGISYEVDVSLVRGLDYYTGTVFEVIYEGLGAQSTVVAGGRYDNLIRELGGTDLPAVGFGCGIERLIIALKMVNPDFRKKKCLQIFVVTADSDVQTTALRYVNSIRTMGYSSDMDYLGMSLKAQMKTASKVRAKYAVIVGSDNGIVTVRNMQASEQQDMAFEDFLAMIGEDKSLQQQTETIEMYEGY